MRLRRMSRGLLRRIRYKGYFDTIGAKLRGVQLNKALVNYHDAKACKLENKCIRSGFE